MADHDQMEERAIALWRRFHFPLIIVILTILSGIIGFTYTGTKREEARLAMGDALFGVRAAADDGDLAKARELFAKMTDDDFASMRHLAAFAVAALLADEGDTDDAAALLREVAERDDDIGVRQMAHLRLAEIYINSGKSMEAMELLNDEMPGNGRMRILFLERIGDAAFAAGDTEEALSAYNQASDEARREFPSYLAIMRIKIKYAFCHYRAFRRLTTPSLPCFCRY